MQQSRCACLHTSPWTPTHLPFCCLSTPPGRLATCLRRRRPPRGMCSSAAGGRPARSSARWRRPRAAWAAPRSATETSGGVVLAPWRAAHQDSPPLRLRPPASALARRWHVTGAWGGTHAGITCSSAAPRSALAWLMLQDHCHCARGRRPQHEAAGAPVRGADGRARVPDREAGR